MQTEKEIQEMNKVIAEFMGGIITDKNTCKGYTKMKIPEWAFKQYDFDTMKISGYEYHSSWDWLMPVVEKIESIDNDFQVDISLVSCRIFQTSKLFTEDDLLIESDENNKINAVFVAVHSFIIFHNQRAGKEENN